MQKSKEDRRADIRVAELRWPGCHVMQVWLEPNFPIGSPHLVFANRDAWLEAREPYDEVEWVEWIVVRKGDKVPTRFDKCKRLPKFTRSYDDAFTLVDALSDAVAGEDTWEVYSSDGVVKFEWCVEGVAGVMKGRGDTLPEAIVDGYLNYQTGKGIDSL